MSNPPDINKQIGSTLHQLRRVAKVSQVELGRELALHQTAICRVEKGLQSLHPWELMTVAEFFGVSVDAIIAGALNYWDVAERFKVALPFPKQYIELAHSRLRDFLPILDSVKRIRGAEFETQFLSTYDLRRDILVSPDQPLGIVCHLEMLRNLKKRKILTPRAITLASDISRTERIQGFLYPLFNRMNDSIELVQSWILNAHHYESNFLYSVEKMKTRQQISVSIEPAPHMKHVEYSDEVLGSVLCDYRKALMTDLPKYIGKAPLKVTESECQFSGAKRCVYHMKIA